MALLLDLQSHWTCRFVSCSRKSSVFTMKNSFSILFVIFSAALNREAFCYTMNCKDIYNNSALTRLKDYLFCYYDSDSKPTESYGNATLIRYGLHVHHFDVDEVSNTVDFSVWSRLLWTDSHLTWNPSEYEDIVALRVMSYEIWTPDIALHTASNAGVEIEMPPVECWLRHSGELICVPSTVYTTFCQSDHTWWPYDVMNCTLEIASWSHTDNEIDLHFATFDTDGQLTTEMYEKNSQWKVDKTSVSEHVVDSKFGLNFSSQILSYNIILSRHSSPYTGIYVTLTIVLMTMTLMVLWLEPRSTERMIVGNLNFVLHLICLQDIQWWLPFNGPRPPEIIFLYENSLLLATFSLILTSILRYVQELNTEPPTWISSTTVSILKSRVGQVLFVSILDPKVSARIELNADDSTNLVSLDKKESAWRYTSILIGWLAFICVSFIYVILLIAFLPTPK